ncbi:Tol-Pal system protein TolB [Candidatus Magnetaquicoccaceae bacterium FCR-1]|uniref:Tol-Pal system protein TolB n=1 Tax=Candidatus Magnetaquiglobus chichijimensis TaxID=3141448 RepID=A0ABQ0C4D7_9PROT
MNRATHKGLSFSYLLLVSLLVLCLPGMARAGLQIDISKGGLQPMPIAIPKFLDTNPDGSVNPSAAMGNRIADVIASDLERSGLFQILDRKGFLQDSASLWKEGPNFSDWRKNGAEAVVSGAVIDSGGQVNADFFLHDVYRGAPVGKGQRFSAPKPEWHLVAHRIADEIYSRLTGESGYFSSRIVFVAERGDKKWLSIMDQDGLNRTDLTEGRSLVLTPRFSPSGETIFFVSYVSGEPRIYRRELYTGKTYPEGDYPGLNSAPSWAPDGSKMAMTLNKDGNAEIYVKDLGSGTLTRLTQNPGIDTSPSWSPDGRRIVFNSDRGGSPQIYTMNADGSNQTRITFAGNYNAAPSWSPRGDLIAFVKGGGGGFGISVVNPQGNQERTLTSSWMDESPAWAPNGRVIAFTREMQGKGSKLYTIDLTGQNERIVPMEADIRASDPSWSPLLR